MNAEEWRRVNDAFHAALELVEDERAEYIEKTLPETPLLRAEVLSLLKAFDGAADFWKNRPRNSSRRH